MINECESGKINCVPTDDEIDQITCMLQKYELSNSILSKLYGCDYLEIDDDISGEREIVRMVFLDDKPSLDLDLNSFRQLCYDLRLCPESFNKVYPAGKKVVEEIKERNKKIEEALHRNFKKVDRDAYHHLVEYLNNVFMHISCDYETEINNFIDKIPFLTEK